MGKIIYLSKGQTVALLYPVDYQSIKEVDDIEECIASVQEFNSSDEEVSVVDLPEHLRTLVNSVSPNVTESEKHKISKL